ncbi:TPA: hypothetical protein R1962_002522, partial [Staphylococcus delphini]|nr:hypothetical protein [Staphylococcus delphini]
DFQNEAEENMYLVFSDSEYEVDNLINEMNINIDKGKIVYGFPRGKLFLQVTPFVYITNKEDLIIEKKIINKIKDI